jgi:hypothetical protein
MLYMVTFTMNIPPMLAYIPYMDTMGIATATTIAARKLQLASATKFHALIYVYRLSFYLFHTFTCCVANISHYPSLGCVLVFTSSNAPEPVELPLSTWVRLLQTRKEFPQASHKPKYSTSVVSRVRSCAYTRPKDSIHQNFKHDMPQKSAEPVELRQPPVNIKPINSPSMRPFVYSLSS